MNYQQNQYLAKALGNHQPVQNGGFAGALAQGLAGFGSGYFGGQAQMQQDKTRKALAEALAKGDQTAVLNVLATSDVPEYQAMGLKSQLELMSERDKAKTLASALEASKNGNMAALMAVPGGLDMAVKMKQLNEPNVKVVGGGIYDANTGKYTAMPSNAPIDPETGQPERKLSATEQKELFDTMDLANSGEAAVGALTKAKDILTSSPEGAEPYTGFGAEVRASAARLPVIGDVVADKERGAATTEYKTLVTEQALNNLKAIFGGMPTEGERAILMQMQALPSYTPEEQQRIIDNAVSAANKRLEFNKKKSGAIRTGQYSQMGKPFKDASPAADTEQPSMITTQEEFDALPSGTLYMEDDGQTYRKP